MRKFLKNYALFIVTSFGMLISSCEKDLYVDPINQNQYYVKVFSLEDIKNETLFQKNVTKLNYEDAKNKRFRRSADSTYTNFTIDSTKVKRINYGNKISYTMKINRETPTTGYFENLVLEVENQNSTKAYIIRYEPTQEMVYDEIAKDYHFDGNPTQSKLYGQFTIIQNEDGTSYIDPNQDDGSWQNTTCVAVLKCNDRYPEHNVVPGWCTIPSFIYTVIVCTTSGIPNGGGSNGGNSSGPSSWTSNNNSNGYGGSGPNNNNNIIPPVTTPVYTEPPVNIHNIPNADCASNVCDLIAEQFYKKLSKQEKYMMHVDGLYFTFANYLQANMTGNIINPDALAYANEAVDRMMANPNLKIDVLKSSKSPAYIDTSSINNNSPEGAKFNAVYNALMTAQEFKTLLKDLFGSPQSLYNVKFEIAEHIYDSDNPTEEVNGNCSPVSTNNLITIKINKQILTPGGDIWKNNLEVAKTILHEFIHAYLFVKAKYPDIGVPIPNAQNMTFDEICNALYGQNVQHDFMFSHMVPTLQNILSQMLNSLTTPVKRAEVEGLTMHPTIAPLTSTPWSWNNYFYNLSLQGLDGTTSFQSDFQLNSTNLNLYVQYKELGHIYLDRIIP